MHDAPISVCLNKLMGTQSSYPFISIYTAGVWHASHEAQIKLIAQFNRRFSADFTNSYKLICRTLQSQTPVTHPFPIAEATFDFQAAATVLHTKVLQKNQNKTKKILSCWVHLNERLNEKTSRRAKTEGGKKIRISQSSKIPIELKLRADQR